MRRFLLDTSIIAAYLNNRPQAVQIVQPWIQRREAATSILVYGEVIEYLKGVPNYLQRRRQLRELLTETYPYFLTYSILERYSDIRRQLRPPQGPGLIGDIDTVVAATALERKLTVVTTDGDYQRVPSLQVMLVSFKK